MINEASISRCTRKLEQFRSGKYFVSIRKSIVLHILIEKLDAPFVVFVVLSESSRWLYTNML